MYKRIFWMMVISLSSSYGAESIQLDLKSNAGPSLKKIMDVIGERFNQIEPRAIKEDREFVTDDDGGYERVTKTLAFKLPAPLYVTYEDSNYIVEAIQCSGPEQCKGCFGYDAMEDTRTMQVSATSKETLKEKLNHLLERAGECLADAGKESVAPQLLQSDPGAFDLLYVYHPQDGKYFEKIGLLVCMPKYDPVYRDHLVIKFDKVANFMKSGKPNTSYNLTLMGLRFDGANVGQASATPQKPLFNKIA